MFVQNPQNENKNPYEKDFLKRRNSEETNTIDFEEEEKSLQKNSK